MCAYDIRGVLIDFALEGFVIQLSQTFVNVI